MIDHSIVLIAGAGGFVGGHLVKMLRDRNNVKIRAVDNKPLDQWFQSSPGVDNLVLDLRLLENCRKATNSCTHIYNLAAIRLIWKRLAPVKMACCS